MAVYQGARPRLISLPGRPRIAEGPTLERRRARTAIRAGRRTNRLGLVLTGIVVAFLLAFFWLAQDVRVSATGYDIGRARGRPPAHGRQGPGPQLGPEPPRARAGHPQAGHR